MRAAGEGIGVTAGVSRGDAEQTKPKNVTPGARCRDDTSIFVIFGRRRNRTAPSHNAGAGTLLLAKAKEEMPQGFSLWTFQANLGARRFYKRHGCREIRRRMAGRKKTCPAYCMNGAHKEARKIKSGEVR